MATRDEIGRELLERIQEDHPELYEALLGSVTKADLPAEPKTQAEKEAEIQEAYYRNRQAELKKQMEEEVSKTKGFYQRGIIRDKYLRMGLHKPYEPDQQAKTPEELRSLYQQEMQGVRGGTEQALIIRQKYRKLGLDL
jgi:hypothetical protein